MAASRGQLSPCRRPPGPACATIVRPGFPGLGPLCPPGLGVPSCSHVRSPVRTSFRAPAHPGVRFKGPPCAVFLPPVGQSPDWARPSKDPLSHSSSLHTGRTCPISWRPCQPWAPSGSVARRWLGGLPAGGTSGLRQTLPRLQPQRDPGSSGGCTQRSPCKAAALACVRSAGGVGVLATQESGRHPDNQALPPTSG